MTTHLGEVTSVEFDHEGKYLLAACKDNSNRLWDLRMVSATGFLAHRLNKHLNHSNVTFTGTLVTKTLRKTLSGPGLHRRRRASLPAGPKMA